MRTICRSGEEYVLPEAVRWNHKHYDVSGYPPDGALIGIDLPLGARLVPIADVFDAPTSKRSYRRDRPIVLPGRGP